MKQPFVIAIDGPAGSGKSSIAKIIAHNLNLVYIDTGAMYRALTLKIINHKIDLNNQKVINQLLQNTTINYNSNKELLIDNTIVAQDIRDAKVNDLVSDVAKIEAVRTFLVDNQRRLGCVFNTIMDGRDIGTVVFPKADLKIFLTASITVRAQRRLLQNQTNNLNKDIDIVTLSASIERRDKIDTQREIGALKQADDVWLIDTTNLTFNQTVLKITALINKIILKKDVK